MADRECSVDGCERLLTPPYGRGMCGMHYKRWAKHGDPLHVTDRRKWPEICSVGECGKPMLARGWCSAHWTRWQRYGSPTFRIPGEVVNGCRVCPACEQDKTLSAYTADKTGACKSCLARRKRARMAFCPPPLAPSRECACRACGAAFQGNARNQTFCSPSCFQKEYGQRSQRRRALQRELAGVQFMRREVFERDNWTCGICDEAIDRELVWPDRMYGVVDHVIPLSRGGAHSIENVQAAHNLCNARKGARVEPILEGSSA